MAGAWYRGRPCFQTLQEFIALCMNFNRVISRVAASMSMNPKEVTAFGKSPQTVKARALLCYWAHRKLGMTATEIAGRLKITQPAASRLSKQGEQIEKEVRFSLIGK
ncbi:MAG: hypothetical protein HY788_03830 [Deltaproteobacteria bacterium]|nr:hypothetical protein [Deltaproteobacteria bacterium]